MKYVILGSSAAGVNAGRELRTLDPNSEITMISKDREIYSRCILHHYLGDIRSIPELDFAERDYFNRFNINFLGGEGVSVLNTTAKTVTTEKGSEADVAAVGADRRVILTGIFRTKPKLC